MSPKYQHAYDAVSKLINSDPDAVKKLRRVERCFKKMTAETFRQSGCLLTNDEIEILLGVFSGKPQLP